MSSDLIFLILRGKLLRKEMEVQQYFQLNICIINKSSNWKSGLYNHYMTFRLFTSKLGAYSMIGSDSVHVPMFTHTILSLTEHKILTFAISITTWLLSTL